MSLIDELRKKGKVKLRIEEYLRWVALVFLVAIALVAAGVLVIALLAGESALKFIGHLAEHIYDNYGLIPVLILLLVAAVAAVAFAGQLAMTCIVYRKAYHGKRKEGGGSPEKPALLTEPGKKTGWARGYYQGVVLLVTNALVAVLLVAGVVYALGYVGIEAAEQPEFCLMCHEVMKPSYDSYAASTHKGVHCGECHNDPGVKGFVKGEVIAPVKEGWLQVSGEYLDKGGGRVPMVVHMNNESCLRGECHKEKRLREKVFRARGLSFSHEKHLDLEHGGHPISCASCHTYDKEVHMKVDLRVCGLCHFSSLSKKHAGKEMRCEACHAVRPALEDEKNELMHRRVADLAGLACNDCHDMVGADFAMAPNACNQCKKKHAGMDKTPAGQGDLHHKHHGVRCSLCHLKLEHKRTSEKFRTVPASPFGLRFTHETHEDRDCSDCHREEAGRFALKLEGRDGCIACHHEDVESTDTCDGCHELAKIKVFAKEFKHESHPADCADCHDRKMGSFKLTLKSARDCAACHHVDVESTDTCDGCHDAPKIEVFGRKFTHESHPVDCKDCHGERKEGFRLTLEEAGDCNACHHGDTDAGCGKCHAGQQEFFDGKEKFGIEEMPSIKVVAELGCDTCHEDMVEYKRGQAKAACTNCHDEDDPFYSFDKLLQKNRELFKAAGDALRDAQARLSTARRGGARGEHLAGATKALADAEAILKFLRDDGSLGLHNIGLFEEFAARARKLAEEAEALVEEALKGSD